MSGQGGAACSKFGSVVGQCSKFSSRCYYSVCVCVCAIKSQSHSCWIFERRILNGLPVQSLAGFKVWQLLLLLYLSLSLAEVRQLKVAEVSLFQISEVPTNLNDYTLPKSLAFRAKWQLVVHLYSTQKRGYSRAVWDVCKFWICGRGPGFKSCLGMFFLNKKKFVFRELDGELSL